MTTLRLPCRGDGVCSVNKRTGFVMVRALKTSFVWQFVGGFVLGTIGLVALQPSAASRIGRHLVYHVEAKR